MKNFLIILRVPLALEAANVLLHRVTHWIAIGNIYSDTASTLVSLAIVLYAAWLVARQTARTSQGILGGLAVWLFSLGLVALLMTMEVFLGAGVHEGEGAMAIAGFAFSSMLILPAVIAAAAIAALVARRRAA